MNGKNWTKEEDDIILKGHSPKELEALLPHRSYASLKLRRSKFIKEGKLSKLHMTVPKRSFTPEEMLDVVRKFRSCDALKRACVGDPNLPNPKTVQKQFGSWSNARKLAGVESNQFKLVDYYPTILYLVKFEDFYKIGITQRDIKSRLWGYPPYEIIDQILFEDLEIALSIEAELLNNVSRDSSLMSLGGKTECFRYHKDLSSLEDLL